METDVSLDEFNRALKAVRPALKDASAGGDVVHLQASKDAITLVATGRTMTVRRTVPAHSLAPGQIVVPARFLASVCLRGTDSELRLSVADDDDLRLGCGELEATVRHRPGDAPTPIVVNSPGTIGQLSASELARLSGVASAASMKLDRPILTGIHLASGVGEATDSYRVARTRLASWTQDAVVPASLVQLVASSETEVAVSFDGRVMEFSTRNASWAGPVLAYSYPLLNLYFTADVLETFVCSRELLLDAVETARVVHSAPVHLVGEGDRLRVWSESAQIGLVQTSLPAKAKSGSQASFSSGYLHDALKVATSEEVHLELAETFGLIRCENYEQLVMKQVAATTPEEADALAKSAVAD